MKRHKTKNRPKDIVTHASTLCWRCAKSVNNGCSWSARFEPVQGWTAEETVLKRIGIGGKSYLVIDCPEFERG